MQKDEELVQIRKGLLENVASLCHLIKKMAKVFFEVGSDGALFEIRQTLSHHWNMTDEVCFTRRVGGVSETFITFLIPHQQSKTESQIFINQSVSKVNIVNSVQPFTDFIRWY